jgi:transposase-like protein
MGYSTQRRESVLKKMLPPNNRSIRELSGEEGISEATLYLWRQKAREEGRFLPDVEHGHSDKWSSSDKFAAVLESAALNESQLAEYCRKRGVYPEQIKAWRKACEQANDWQRDNYLDTHRLVRKTGLAQLATLHQASNATGPAREKRGKGKASKVQQTRECPGLAWHIQRAACNENALLLTALPPATAILGMY